MAPKKRRKAPAVANTASPPEQEGPPILLGDWRPRVVGNALGIANLVLICPTGRRMCRAVTIWAAWVILSSQYPPETSGLDFAGFLAQAFQREWGRRKAGDENDVVWLRQLFREMVNAANDDAQGYLVLATFGRLFLDPQIRDFFGGWSQRGPVLKAFYAEACEFADKLNAAAGGPRCGARRRP